MIIQSLISNRQRRWASATEPCGGLNVVTSCAQLATRSVMPGTISRRAGLAAPFARRILQSEGDMEGRESWGGNTERREDFCQTASR